MRAIFHLLLLAATTPLLAQMQQAQTEQAPGGPPSEPYTLRTESNVVLVPTTVQTKKGDMIYTLKPEQFVVEDNGVPQTIHLDEDTDSLGLSLAVVVQCSREAFMEFSKFEGLGTMIDAISGGAPREVALIVYGGKPVLVGNFRPIRMRFIVRWRSCSPAMIRRLRRWMPWLTQRTCWRRARIIFAMRYC